MDRTELEHYGQRVVNTISDGFPMYGLSVWWIILIVVVSLVLLVIWNLTGKGQGSHAGREEVRRSYRRELARQMARQDADKIKAGEKSRRRWMQW